MHRRSLALVALLLALAVPMSASQFIELPFDQVAREARYVVRGTVVDSWSAWDDSREVIYTYATVRVTRYFGETTGPDVLMVRNVGGTVDGYTQEAVGFPVIRRGEQAVFFLSGDDSALEIHAYSQGKFLVRQRDGVEVLVADPVKQGDARLDRGPRFNISTNAIDANASAITLDEFAAMVDDARAGLTPGRSVLRQQN
ncbi:MAG TPA: hypothetical protein VF846_08295 [Thermoanaerobaculia bacterium]